MKDADIKIVGLSNSKPKGKTNWKILGAIIGIVVLAVGVIAGIFLVRQNQNIQEKAAECSAGGAQCPSTTDPTLLRDCSTGEIYPNDSICDSVGRVEVCGTNSSNARQFCCPSSGAAWTTNLTLCNVAATATATSTTHSTATATATATATTTTQATVTSISTSHATATSTTRATATATAIATATSTSRSTSTATSTSSSRATATSVSSRTATPTSAPLPVTGVEWPTMLGIGFGVIMILVSMSLAL